MPTEPILLEVARLLTFRLARLSVDSTWARRSSGLRGSLLKEVDHLETLLQQGHTLDAETLQHLEGLVSQGFKIVEAAARDIRTIDDLNDIRRLLRQ
jgi:hypothetical protein